MLTKPVRVELSFTGQQETFQVVPEALPLIAFAKHGIKVLGIRFQGRWRLGYFNAVCHLTFLLSPHSTILSPCQQSTNKTEYPNDEQQDEQNDEGHHKEQTFFLVNMYDELLKGACDEKAIGEQQGGKGQKQRTQNRDQGSGRETPWLSYQHVQEEPTRLPEKTNQ